ncbi:MAG: zinc ribbon domain-containing protein [Gammaproteobacteria bacterium]
MPIFDYQCEACGHHFDILQKAGEGVLRKCPECGKLKLRKLLSAPSFHLKGGGWYKNPPSEAKADGKADGGKPKKGHNLDGDKSHSHDHGHGHSHGPGGHTHSHGDGGHKH